MKKVILKARDAYVRGKIADEMDEVYLSVEATFELFSKDYLIIMEQE